MERKLHFSRAVKGSEERVAIRIALFACRQATEGVLISARREVLDPVG